MLEKAWVVGMVAKVNAVRWQECSEIGSAGWTASRHFGYMEAPFRDRLQVLFC